MDYEEASDMTSDQNPREGKERRRFQRFEVDASARIEIMGPTVRKRAIFLKTANISANGAYFPTKRSIPLDMPVKMDIFLNFDLKQGMTSDRRMYVLSVTGEVARVDRSGVAVRFKPDYELNPLSMKMFAKN